jgi:hypothetical protein
MRGWKPPLPRCGGAATRGILTAEARRRRGKKIVNRAPCPIECRSLACATAFLCAGALQALPHLFCVYDGREAAELRGARSSGSLGSTFCRNELFLPRHHTTSPPRREKCGAAGCGAQRSRRSRSREVQAISTFRPRSITHIFWGWMRDGKCTGSIDERQTSQARRAGMCA